LWKVYIGCHEILDNRQTDGSGVIVVLSIVALPLVDDDQLLFALLRLVDADVMMVGSPFVYTPSLL
jgi:hypothetical protein